jgi:hypothetical protein
VTIREVEGRAPSPLVEEGGQVVIAVDEAGVVRVALVGGGRGGVETLVFAHGGRDGMGGSEVPPLLCDIT